jgi:crotonobetainyl-CoA:carnitine CoA-transferase CaiB-like acyl-CoA transferase
MTLMGPGFKLAHGGGSVERAPATPGEHTDAVLAEAGYGNAEIAALRSEGVI